MTTLTELRAIIRLSLPDATAWPNATLDNWIAAAINFYSQSFPYTWRHTYTLTTGTQSYNLPAGHGFIAPLILEYPTSQSPQTFLDLVNDEENGRFRSGDDVYTITYPADTTAIESNTTPGLIKFAPTVTTGQSAILTYHGRHPTPAAADDDAIITVPHPHHEIITAYCKFRAYAELSADDAVGLTASTVTLSQLSTHTARAWERLKDIINQAVWMARGKSAVVEWDMTAVFQSRIY